uniref:Uncharacterized protein n=1 Tax=Triticum urartu TaxID=4572 RepID=A0A8R7UQ24_TRIUA
MSEGESPRSVSPTTLGARVFSTLAQRNCGSLATTEATSAAERPRPARKASTASGLAGDLRWESLAEALTASGRVRPQVETRYSSTTKLGLGETAGAAAARRRRTGDAGEVAGHDMRWAMTRLRSWSMAARRRGIPVMGND